jgi:acyl-CoA reductase-like NAD-dependent aldehyde dehydrogenase
LVREHTAHDPARIERALADAVQAQKKWARSRGSARAAPLPRLAELFDERAGIYAELVTT